MSVDPESIPESRREALDEARMSIIEHLSELRDRLIYIIIAVFIGFIVAWFWREPLFQFLLDPLQSAVSEDKSDLTQIYFKDLAEPVFAMIKISLLAGIFGTAPFSLYQVWKFISPGLYAREKRMAVPFVILGTIFFFGGAAFCFFGVLPFGYQFLIEFGADISSEPQLMINEYLGLTTKLLLVFGLVFELPVLAMFLSAMGVIDHNTLLRHWRAAVIIAFVSGALLTPADPMTQMLLSGPLTILYFISIGVAYIFSRRRDRKEAKAEAEGD